jgi:putative endonuclease
MAFIVYIVECSDKTLYVGYTNNLEKRLYQHNNLKSGARYTRLRRPVVLVYTETYQTQREAMQREYEIKQLRRWEKLLLLK